MPRAYYNEIDPYCCDWLQNLMDAGHITGGTIDDRSIVDVRRTDIDGFDRCHFFAGIGGWELALALARWPSGREVWTGSCPCQPLSSAGKRKGHQDDRHLWPEFYRLIAERGPSTVFGEQVSGTDGREWFAAVRLDLEATGYAGGCADLCAAGVGAPHIRQRLFWVADNIGARRLAAEPAARERGRECGATVATDGAPHGDVANAERVGRGTRHVAADRDEADGRGPGGVFGTGTVADPASNRCGQERENAGRGGRRSETEGQRQRFGDDGGAVGMGHTEDGIERESRKDAQPQQPPGRPDLFGGMGESASQGREIRVSAGGNLRTMDGAPQGQTAITAGEDGCGFWSTVVFVLCADGKARPVEPTIQPLAHGVPGRVGQLRASGNAIVPQAAAEFIAAYLECRP